MGQLKGNEPDRDGNYRGRRGYKVPAFIRFWSKVLVGDDCWEWQGAIGNSYGHGRFDNQMAHSWVADNMLKWPPRSLQTKVVDHECRNPKCVRPSHLRLVPQLENLRNGSSLIGLNMAKTHCCRGHPLSGENLGIDKTRGNRFCKHCKKYAYRQQESAYRKMKRRSANAH